MAIEQLQLYTANDLRTWGLSDHFLSLLRQSGLEAHGDLYYLPAIEQALEVLYGVEGRELSARWTSTITW